MAEEENKQPEEKKEPTREEYIYLSKLNERAERFPEMVSSINKFIEMNPKLSKEEKNILSTGYKNIISDKRSSWRFLNNMEKRELKKKAGTNSSYKRNKKPYRKRNKKTNRRCS